MSGLIWMFSDLIDEEDIRMLQHDFITIRMGIDYYGYSEKVFLRIMREAGAVYKIGKSVRINRLQLEKYIRQMKNQKEERGNGVRKEKK